MRRTPALAALALLAGLPVAHASSAPRNACALAWSDPAGDTGLSLAGTGPAFPDDDLDARSVTIRVTSTEVVVTVRVTKLNPSGPLYGTGHGLSLSIVKYGSKGLFAVRKDATFGDRAYASSRAGTPTTPTIKLVIDAPANTFTMVVRRADVAKATQTTAGGSFSYIGVNTIREDARQAQEAVNGNVSPGSVADETTPGEKVGLSLDACDTQLRRDRAKH